MVILHLSLINFKICCMGKYFRQNFYSASINLFTKTNKRGASPHFSMILLPFLSSDPFGRLIGFCWFLRQAQSIVQVGLEPTMELKPPQIHNPSASA